MQQCVTIGDWIYYVQQQLDDASVYCGHGTDNTWDEAVFLVLEAMKLPWHTDKSAMNTVVSKAQQETIKQWLKLRINERKPLPYITGKAHYAGLLFTVDEATLIPRSPISEFIEYAFEPWVTLNSHSRILDLCTGSGCIALAIGHYFPEIEVIGSDICSDALVKAEENKQVLNISNVNFVQSDLFDAINGKFDVIVSNPPYVNAQDMADLPPEFLHEPQAALAAGDDGLDLVKRILKQADQYLNDHGVLIIEVGNSAESLVDQFPKTPFYWPEFDNGGEGVFVLEKAALKYIK